MSDDLLNSGCIRQLVAGDEAAFAAVYDQYSSKVYRLAFRFLKEEAQSEEIVQETFIKLWLSRATLDPEGNLWVYLFVIAKRLSLNALRQMCKSADAVSQLAHHFATVHNTTEEYIIANDLEQYAEKALLRLPRQQQLIFKMSRIQGLTHKEIANKLNISPNTVKNHMVEALKTLRTQFQYADFALFILFYLFL